MPSSTGAPVQPPDLLEAAVGADPPDLADPSDLAETDEVMDLSDDVDEKLGDRLKHWRREQTVYMEKMEKKYAKLALYIPPFEPGDGDTSKAVLKQSLYMTRSDEELKRQVSFHHWMVMRLKLPENAETGSLVVEGRILTGSIEALLQSRRGEVTTDCERLHKEGRVFWIQLVNMCNLLYDFCKFCACEFGDSDEQWMQYMHMMGMIISLKESKDTFLQTFFKDNKNYFDDNRKMIREMMQDVFLKSCQRTIRDQTNTLKNSILRRFKGFANEELQAALVEEGDAEDTDQANHIVSCDYVQHIINVFVAFISLAFSSGKSTFDAQWKSTQKMYQDAPELQERCNDLGIFDIRTITSKNGEALYVKMQRHAETCGETPQTIDDKNMLTCLSKRRRFVAQFKNWLEGFVEETKKKKFTLSIDTARKKLLRSDEGNHKLKYKAIADVIYYLIGGMTSILSCTGKFEEKAEQIDPENVNVSQTIYGDFMEKFSTLCRDHLKFFTPLCTDETQQDKDYIQHIKSDDFLVEVPKISIVDAAAIYTYPSKNYRKGDTEEMAADVASVSAMTYMTNLLKQNYESAILLGDDFSGGEGGMIYADVSSIESFLNVAKKKAVSKEQNRQKDKKNKAAPFIKSGYRVEKLDTGCICDFTERIGRSYQKQCLALRRLVPLIQACRRNTENAANAAAEFFQKTELCMTNKNLGSNAVNTESLREVVGKLESARVLCGELRSENAVLDENDLFKLYREFSHAGAMTSWEERVKLAKKLKRDYLHDKHRYKNQTILSTWHRARKDERSHATFDSEIRFHTLRAKRINLQKNPILKKILDDMEGDEFIPRDLLKADIHEVFRRSKCKGYFVNFFTKICENSDFTVPPCKLPVSLKSARGKYLKHVFSDIGDKIMNDETHRPEVSRSRVYRTLYDTAEHVNRLVQEFSSETGGMSRVDNNSLINSFVSRCKTIVEEQMQNPEVDSTDVITQGAFVKKSGVTMMNKASFMMNHFNDSESKKHHVTETLHESEIKSVVDNIDKNMILLFDTNDSVECKEKLKHLDDALFFKERFIKMADVLGISGVDSCLKEYERLAQAEELHMNLCQQMADVLRMIEDVTQSMKYVLQTFRLGMRSKSVALAENDGRKKEYVEIPCREICKQAPQGHTALTSAEERALYKMATVTTGTMNHSVLLSICTNSGGVERKITNSNDEASTNWKLPAQQLWECIKLGIETELVDEKMSRVKKSVKSEELKYIKKTVPIEENDVSPFSASCLRVHCSQMLDIPLFQCHVWG